MADQEPTTDELSPAHAAAAGLWDWINQGWQQRRAADEASAQAVRAGLPADRAAQNMAQGLPAMGGAPSAPASTPTAPRTFEGPETGYSKQGQIVMPKLGQGGGEEVGAAAPQTVTIPAHEVAAVEPGRQRALLGNIADVGASLGAQAEAARAVGGAEAEQAEGQGASESALASTMGTQAADYMSGVQQRRRAYSDWETRHRGLVDAAKSEDETDPYKELSGIDRIRYGLAGMLGGFMQGWQGGGQNQALVKMHDEMAARVAAQRAKYERAKYKADEDTREFDRAYKMTGDLDQAALHVLGVQQEAAAHEARAMGIASGSPVARAKGEAIAKQLETTRAEMAVKATQQGIAMNPYQQARTVQVGGAGPKPIKDEERKLFVRMPGGEVVKANAEKEAEDLRGQIKSDVRITDLIDQATALRAQGKQGILPSEGKRQLESIAHELVLASKEPGVRFGEGEQKLLEGIIGDPSAPSIAVLGNPATDANLARLRGSRVQNARSYVGGQGLPVVRLGFTRDPKTGALMQTGEMTGRNYSAPTEIGGVPFTPAK